MNFFTWLIVAVYSRLLILYPRRFRNEFADEMQVVFRDSINEAIHEGALSFLFICLKEFGGLPIYVLRELWHEIERKESGMVNVNSATETGGSIEKSRWDALIGTLPFILFGIASMIGKTRLPFHAGYSDLAFCAIMLIGLVIGLAKGFPRWAYSYLGWSMVMSWSWMMAPVDTFQRYRTPLTHNQLIGWWSWTPFLFAIGIGLLFARSFHPIRQLVRGIWHDWTLLSFAMYTLIGLMALIYDENHHPYLFLFMAASTIAIFAGAWLYLNSATAQKRVVSLLTGFVLAFTIMFICDATWDWSAYYGSDPLVEAEFESISRIILFMVVWSLILFWPALIGIARYFTNRQKPGMVA